MATSPRMDAVPEHVAREETAPESVTAVVDSPAAETVKKAADLATALKVFVGALVIFAGLVAASVKVLAEIPSRADLNKAIKPVVESVEAHGKRIDAIEAHDSVMEARHDAQQTATLNALKELSEGQRELLRAVLRQGRAPR